MSRPTKIVYAFICMSLLFVSINNTNAEVYRWIDSDGKVQFSDQKPKDRQVERLNLEVNTYTSVTYEDSIFDTSGSGGRNKRVVMYSTAWCGYCKKARRYFEKKSISYTEYDIEKNKRAKKQYNKMGATGVPVILVGRKRMNGFSVNGFERIYR